MSEPTSIEDLTMSPFESGAFFPTSDIARIIVESATRLVADANTWITHPTYHTARSIQDEFERLYGMRVLALRLNRMRALPDEIAFAVQDAQTAVERVLKWHRGKRVGRLDLFSMRKAGV